MGYVLIVGLGALFILGAWKLGEIVERIMLCVALGKSGVKLQMAREAICDVGFDVLESSAIVNNSPLAKQEYENGRR